MPPRSSDLSPLVFFLWGYLKKKIDKQIYDKVEALKTVIREKLNQFDVRTVLKATRTVKNTKLYR